MKNLTPATNKQLVKDLKGHVQKLQSKLKEVTKDTKVDENIGIKVQKAEVRFNKERNPKGPDQGLGHYLLIIDVTAKKETAYLPISVASGRVSTGFVYQVEGTARGVSTATISSKGVGIFKVTSGSILYSKIPTGKTATFKILGEIKGALGKEYRIVISRVNYKLNPNDLRYKRVILEIPTKTLKFN